MHDTEGNGADVAALNDVLRCLDTVLRDLAPGFAYGYLEVTRADLARVRDAGQKHPNG